MGGGTKSAKFDTIGTTVGGRIVRPPVARQQTDFDSGKPKFYDDGNPMMQVVAPVQTSLRDPQDQADDGVRNIYIRGQLTEAVRNAVRSVGGSGLEVGGELYVTFVREEPNSRGRGKDKKVYSARYVLPGVQAANDALMGNPAPAVTAPAGLPPLPAPATQAAAIPTPPAGVDPAAWAALSDEQRRQYLALLPA
jgi:hypothetical protein